MVYLTLTTRPERVSSPFFETVYDSLKSQTMPFDKLVINLSVNQFEYSIPEYLYKDEDVILNETNICGPCAKLLGAIDVIPPNTPTIVLDDDFVLKNDFIERLYSVYLKHPTKVSANKVSTFELCEKLDTQFDLPVAKYSENFKQIEGFAGYICNIDIVKNIREFYDSMPEPCRVVDDSWISWCFNEMNLEIKRININIWNDVMDVAKTHLHPDWHELGSLNRPKATSECFSQLFNENGVLVIQKD